jgi:phasin family protein
MALQTQLAKDLFQDSVEQAKAQAGATGPQEITQMRTRYAQETAQKMIAAAQQVAEIGNSARVEFSRLLTEQLAAGSQEMADAFQSFFKALPGQNTSMVETMQQAMANANSAFEQIAKASAAAFGNVNEMTRKATARKK